MSKEREIEGKWDVGGGETWDVHYNVGVNVYIDGEWNNFHECSVEEFIKIVATLNAEKVG